MAFDTHVLIVGAGPIGLINAWGMKRLNPRLNIVMLEKYAQYQRTHTLVVHSKQLKAIIEATDSQDDPQLQALVLQLEEDPHIRTDALQEIFTQLAEASGVEIITDVEVKAEDIKERLKAEFPNVRLIVGADGTHSVVSQSLFSKDNQLKYDYDYVLQLRYDINGQVKAPGINTQHFLQLMARKGLIGNEYVGHFEHGKTPVTMQIMISKSDFLALQKATSKNPLKPFAINKPQGADLAETHLPAEINAFLTAYLTRKIQDTQALGQEVDRETIRISVNEAPATHAKEVVTTHDEARVILEGDSALGLSYFKGLNAGLEASAKFFSTMESSIQDTFQNQVTLDSSLQHYQTWFLKDFAPRKVDEVGKYSFLWIRSAMTLMETIRVFKNSSMGDFHEDLTPEIQTYFNHLVKNLGKDERWKLFPHRSYDLVQFWQLEYVPLIHTAKKIAKIFIDYVKPYKSKAQISQDFRQPLVGLANASIGLIKILKGIFRLNFKLIVDGLFSVIRGSLEITTTPLTWFIKPLFRGLATLYHGGYKKIEENDGIQFLVQLGQKQLMESDNSNITSNSKVFELLGICHDLHRKYIKSNDRGQVTSLEREAEGFERAMNKTKVDRNEIARYFSLFSSQKQKEEAKHAKRTESPVRAII